MNARPFFLSILLSAAFLAAADAGAAAAPVYRVEFESSDRLSGRPLYFDQGKTMLWSHPSADKPIPLDSNNIISIVRASESGKMEAPAGGASTVYLTLTNKDELPGVLKQLDADHVLVQTDYAGLLKIPRKMIKHMSFVSGDSVIYQGPTTLEGWNQTGSSQWKFHDKSFYNRRHGSIGRNLPLAKSIDVSFDLAWKDYLYFKVHLYSDEETYRTQNDGYMFQFNYQSVYLRRYISSKDREKQGVGMVNPVSLGNVTLQNLMRQRSARIRILVNRPAGVIHLYVNGDKVRTWNDQYPFSEIRQGVVFSCQGSSATRISRLSIRRWNGYINDDSDAIPRQDKSRDFLYLANSDYLEGKLQVADGQKFRFESDLGELLIPQDRIATAYLAAKSPEQARMMKGDVHCHFNGGGRVTVQLKKLEDGKLHAYSENFGDAILDLDAFKRIDMYIYRDNFARILKERNSNAEANPVDWSVLDNTNTTGSVSKFDGDW